MPGSPLFFGGEPEHRLKEREHDYEKVSFSPGGNDDVPYCFLCCRG